MPSREQRGCCRPGGNISHSMAQLGIMNVRFVDFQSNKRDVLFLEAFGGTGGATTAFSFDFATLPAAMKER